jgi:hypothetical protein
MKKQDILKELQAISGLMSNNVIGAWDRDLESTSDAILLEDLESGSDDEPETIKYNGWSDRLNTLIESLAETTKLHDMVVKAGEILSHDSSISYEELEKEVIRLTKLTDVHVSLDHTLNDDFCPTEENEHCYTVDRFLKEIGYVAD